MRVKGTSSSHMTPSGIPHTGVYPWLWKQDQLWSGCQKIQAGGKKGGREVGWERARLPLEGWRPGTSRLVCVCVCTCVCMHMRVHGYMCTQRQLGTRPAFAGNVTWAEAGCPSGGNPASHSTLFSFVRYTHSGKHEVWDERILKLKSPNCFV